jgi:hypothetical protein
MPYIGQAPTSTAFLTDSFSGNGSTTVFTMSVAPANTASVLVAVSGVLQDPTTYSVTGTTLTFSAAPPSGTANISVRYLGIPASGVTTTAYRTVTEFTATAGQKTFTPPSYTVGFINVYRNGVLLGSADYTASNGTTVVLANGGAAAGDLVTIESFYVSSVLNAIPAIAGSVGSTYLASNLTLTNPTLTNPTLSSPSVSGSLTMTSGGITFNANPGTGTQAILNDYEVGTYTPTISNSSGAISYTAYGFYVKTGRMVNVSVQVVISSATPGTLSFTLPFAAANLTGYNAAISGRENAVTGSMIQGYVGTGQSAVITWTYNNGATAITSYNLLMTITYESNV